jgi:hypothetical protein
MRARIGCYYAPLFFFVVIYGTWERINKRQEFTFVE